jgi:hypothetical protein
LKKNGFYRAIKFFATLSPQGLLGRERPVFLIGFVVATFCIGTMVSPMGQAVPVETGNPPKQTPKQSEARSDLQRLEGRWVRPDGGYILELREIKKDGSILAAYFNPKPINVFNAKWSRKEGKINLFVELRDINYPGSKYNLQYEPGSDRLKGTYFQAVERQTFNIEFVRVKSKKEGQ